MFGRLATARIKSAEDALAAGRLDEAFEIAISTKLDKHEGIGRLRSQLAGAFFERGQDRLMSRKFAEAISDFERAGRCGFQSDKIQEWRRRAQQAFDVDRAAGVERTTALNEARQRADAGSLVGAAEALERTPADDPARGALESAIERQGRQASEALSAANHALDRDDLHAAASQIRIAKKLHTKLEGLAETEHRLIDRTVERARAAFESGRLDRARQDLDALAGLDIRRGERIEVEELVREASAAAAAFASHDYAQAALLLGRLAKLNARAEWAAEAKGHLDAIETAWEAVMEGPLGLLSRACAGGVFERAALSGETLSARAVNIAPPPVYRGSKDVVAMPVHQAVTPGLARRILLRVDGVGSFLLIRGDRVSIGRAGPGSTADIQLVSDLADRQAEIVRAGEDYFVVSQSGVELAGSNVDHALLQDGDRVRLGKRVRLKFKRPSLKSSAAVLELGEGVRMENDCRRAVLWSGPILLGGLKECHVPAPQIEGQYVLMERGGKMFAKRVGPASEAVPVELGAPFALGDLRLTAMACSASSLDGRVIG